MFEKDTLSPARTMQSNRTRYIRCVAATTGKDFDDTVCSKRTCYPCELENFVLGFCSILMSRIQFITAYDASVLPGSSVEAERGIFDYYAVMRRIESCDLYMTVAIRGSV